MIKKNDFIELEYTGRIKESNIVFDTTNEVIAKANNLDVKNIKYTPAVICVGQAQLLPAIDTSLENRSVGESYKIELKPESAFGNKDAELIQFIPTNSFLESNVQPVSGLHVNIDGAIGLIKVVSGGRAIVDFNHPLAGKDVVYEITIKRIISEPQEKLKALLKNMLPYEPELELKDSTAIITLYDIKIEEEKIKEKIKELIPEITTIQFNQKQANN